MRNLKHIIGLSLALSFSLTACGGTSNLNEAPDSATDEAPQMVHPFDDSINEASTSSDGASMEDASSFGGDAPSDPTTDYIEPTTGRDFGLAYFDYDGMEPDRQAYRLGVCSDGVRINGMTDVNLIIRDISSYSGSDCYFTGTITWMNSTRTCALVRFSDDAVIQVDATSALNVVQGDYITVFGMIVGRCTYNNTDIYGRVTTPDALEASIEDYFFGDMIFGGKIFDTPDGDIMNNGTPEFTPEEKDYWFKTYKDGFILTENSIGYNDGQFNSPYTVYAYQHNQNTGGYRLFVRYDNSAGAYIDNGYNMIELDYSSVGLTTKESIINVDEIDPDTKILSPTNGDSHLVNDYTR